MGVASDRPRPSARVWILVVSPPRERPMLSRACVSATVSPFDGSRGVLVGTHDGGIDLIVPVDVVVELGQCDHLGSHAGPRAVGGPPGEALMRGFHGP